MKRSRAEQENSVSGTFARAVFEALPAPWGVGDRHPRGGPSREDAAPGERARRTRGEPVTHEIVCPACEGGELRPDPFLVRCSCCEYALSRDLYKTLRQIRALPEAIGELARRRCGHPQTRRPPGGSFHCPACGAQTTGRETGEHDRGVRGTARAAKPSDPEDPGA